MAKFTACFDASGHELDLATPFVVVAGFISTAEKWADFDGIWRKRLAADGLSLFHASDLKAFKNEFKNGWRGNELRQRSLLEDLLEIIRSNTFRWVGKIIVNKDLAVLSLEQRKKWHINAYSYAASGCIGATYNWQSRETITSPMMFVFEDGDFGRGELLTRAWEDFRYRPILWPKKDTIDKAGNLRVGFTPFQAADFLAYEMFQACGKGSYPTYEPSWVMEEFNNMIHEPVSVYDGSALTTYAMERGVLEALQDWPRK